MCWLERLRGCLVAAGLLACVGTSPVAAADYVVGLGVEADTEDGLAFAALADLALGERTWGGVSAAYSRLDGAAFVPDTRYLAVELDHYFAPLGVRAGVGYWGDPDTLESLDLRASLYWRTAERLLSVDAERRDFDLTLGTALLPVARSVAFNANGFGLHARQEVAERFDIYAGGMWYDYSRNLEPQRDIDSLRLLARSRLALMNSLIDNRWHVGFETAFGLRALDLRFASWRNAVDGNRVDSLGVGFLTPLSGRTDVELRLSFDESGSFGRSTVLSVFLYFLGGS